MRRWLVSLLDMPITSLLLVLFVLVWVSAAYLGFSTDWAQLALAVGLGAAA
jgi:hypothetical protein